MYIKSQKILSGIAKILLHGALLINVLNEVEGLDV